jgi:hypothetical protein
VILSGGTRIIVAVPRCGNPSNAALLSGMVPVSANMHARHCLHLRRLQARWASAALSHAESGSAPHQQHGSHGCVSVDRPSFDDGLSDAEFHRLHGKLPPASHYTVVALPIFPA